MLTQDEIVARYRSDVAYAKQLFANDTISRSELDAMIESIDGKFFDEIDMLSLITPTAELERILAYS